MGSACRAALGAATLAVAYGCATPAPAADPRRPPPGRGDAAVPHRRRGRARARAIPSSRRWPGQIAGDPARSVVVFLGDNIYPAGPSARGRSRAPGGGAAPRRADRPRPRGRRARDLRPREPRLGRVGPRRMGGREAAGPAHCGARRRGGRDAPRRRMPGPRGARRRHAPAPRRARHPVVAPRLREAAASHVLLPGGLRGRGGRRVAGRHRRRRETVASWSSATIPWPREGSTGGTSAGAITSFPSGPSGPGCGSRCPASGPPTPSRAAAASATRTCPGP